MTISDLFWFTKVVGSGEVPEQTIKNDLTHISKQFEIPNEKQSDT